MFDLSSLLSPLSVKGSELYSSMLLTLVVCLIFLSLLSIHVCIYSLCCITTHIVLNYFLLSFYLLFSSPHTLLVHVSLASPLVVFYYSCLPGIEFRDKTLTPEERLPADDPKWTSPMDGTAKKYPKITVATTCPQLFSQPHCRNSQSE
jgi:hypothetical protein